MKTSNILIPLVAIALCSGCQSHEAGTASRTPVASQPVTRNPSPQEGAASTVVQPSGPTRQVISTANAEYTIESIPNPHLSATSREGDNNTNAVYSSNIIAVYVRPKGVTVNSTNAPPASDLASRMQPAGK